jgi:hypothetical protein
MNLTAMFTRAQLRNRLLRAVEALDDERLSDDDALAIAHNTVATALIEIDTIENSPAFRPSLVA